jgi:hypothetical protein
VSLISERVGVRGLDCLCCGLRLGLGRGGGSVRSVFGDGDGELVEGDNADEDIRGAGPRFGELCVAVCEARFAAVVPCVLMRGGGGERLVRVGGALSAADAWRSFPSAIRAAFAAANLSRPDGRTGGSCCC